MKKERVDDTRFSKDFCGNEIITAENVKYLGEKIAISGMKKVMPYCNNKLDDLYAGLVHDIYDSKPIDEPYSDGYDIACEAILFLCEHIGESVNKVIKMDKKGREITIIWACYRKVFNYIDKLKCHIYYDFCIKDSTLINKPSIEIDAELDKDNDYIDDAIVKMQLNQGQLDTLNCYMAGMTFVKIARFLGVNNGGLET